MINFKLIYKVLGSLLLIEATMIVCCLGISLHYHEDDVLGFTVSLVVIILMAIGFRRMGLHAENSMGRRDAYLLVTLTWIIFSIFGALPFLISGYLPNYTDAFFETMSGFTTTGASVIANVEALPHGIIFWRSMMQWIGGLGIVFFTIAILPSLVGGNVRVFSAEATGPMRTKMHPRLSTSAKAIWVVYLVLTVGCGVGFYLAGMDIFDCLNYAMTITATGGFGTHNASDGYFHSEAIDYTATAFMFLSGVNFTLMYMTIVKGKIKNLVKDSEVRFYVAIVLIATAAIMFFLMKDMSYDFLSSLRYALFEVVSFTTTAGIFTTDVGQWPHITWIILCLCAFIGACSGSTTSGFKSVRALMLFKIVKNEFKRIIHPKAILPVRVKDGNVATQAQITLFVCLVLYLLVCLFAYVMLTCMGIDSTNSIMIALSCASNVGAPLDLEIGPSMSWDMLPVLGKWVCSFLMLMGRLEFFSVLVLFTPAFWREN